MCDGLFGIGVYEVNDEEGNGALYVTLDKVDAASITIGKAATNEDGEVVFIPKKSEESKNIEHEVCSTCINWEHSDITSALSIKRCTSKHNNNTEIRGALQLLTYDVGHCNHWESRKEWYGSRCIIDDGEG